jgi:hypothetical protein
MTTHTYHPDIDTHGLADDCPRCQEHTRHPEWSLDEETKARLRRGEVYTETDRSALVMLMYWEDR